jgi:hypothetical protein
MIKFFKKIRRKSVLENSKLKFVRYAVVEIILVVIGILIAVTINNWNENNKKNKFEIGLLEELLADTKTDSTFFKSRVYHLNSYINNVNNLNRIDNGSANEAVLKTPFNNYRMFDIGMSYQSTVNSNTKDKVEEFSNKKIQELLRKYILQYNYITCITSAKSELIITLI